MNGKDAFENVLAHARTTSELRITPRDSAGKLFLLEPKPLILFRKHENLHRRHEASRDGSVLTSERRNDSRIRRQHRPLSVPAIAPLKDAARCDSSGNLLCPLLSALYDAGLVDAGGRIGTNGATIPMFILGRLVQPLGQIQFVAGCGLPFGRNRGDEILAICEFPGAWITARTVSTLPAASRHLGQDASRHFSLGQIWGRS